jgi:hypothetical protein
MAFLEPFVVLKIKHMRIKLYIHLLCVSVLLFSITGGSIKAQQPDTFLYCIGVKQEFSSWGNCSSDPDFQYAEIKLLSGDFTLSQETIHSDRLTKMVVFNQNFYYNGSDKSVSKLKTAANEVLSKINVHTNASDIINDNDLDYPFEVATLKTGINSQAHEASDPCHNFISSNREGYTMTTSIYIDDPIHLINNNSNPRYCLDYEVLSLQVGNYYVNGRNEKPVLQVGLDNGTENWETVSNIIINPNATINLTYEMIAGKKKDPNSHFFPWMGRSLKFRIVKTLLNGKQTIGSKAVGIVFYPQGIQYTIQQIWRTSCSNDVTIKVQLEDGADEKYFTLADSLFYWGVAEGDHYPYTSFFRCTMQLVNGEYLTYKLIVRDNNGNDPFCEANTIPLERKLQLMDKKHLGNVACVKSFTIPAKPDPVSISQKPPDYNINGVLYHVPDMNNPYAMLEIDDPYTFSYLRQPYKIMNGTDELLTIDKLPTTYDEMTQHQKDSLDALFEAEFSQMVAKPNNAYNSYFNLRLNEWWNTNKNGIALPIPVYASNYKFSHDASFFLYEKTYIYKAINDGKTYPTTQLINQTTLGIEIGAISPDNNTLIYTLGSCCTGSTIWKTPLNGTGINNGSKIILPFDYNIGGTIGFLVHNPNIFFDNENIVLGRYSDATHGIYKKNIVTGALTTMYSGVFYFEPCLSPDGSFVVFRNSNNWYKGTITTNLINASTIVKVANGDFFTMSPDGTYGLIVRDKKTYKVPLIGDQIGTETEVLDREIDHYNFILTKDGRCIYYYNGTSPGFTDKGLYLSLLNGGIGTKICSTSYADYLTLEPYDKYLLYNSSGITYKLYVGIEEAATDFYPDKDVASTWYNSYKSIYKTKWLNQRLGVRVSKNIIVNDTMHLKLVDNDNCEYPFKVYVKAPPQASFTYTVTKTPSDACARDGEVSVTYGGGGVPPYLYQGKSLTASTSTITVTGLGYGDNTIYFSDASGNESASLIVSIGNATIGLTSTPTTDQTCPTANGSVTINVGNVSGDKYYTLTCDYPHAVYTSGAIASNSHTFSGLPTGTYKAEVTSGTCYFSKEDISVASNIFDITTPISVTDATTLDGTGEVSINFANRVNNVTWVSGTPAVFNQSESSNNATYSGVNPSTYNVVVRHTDTNGACDVSKNFTVNKPQFSAAVNLEENDTKLTVRTSLSNSNLLLSPFKIRLLKSDGTVVSESTSNGQLSTDIQTTGNYIINLQYGSTNEADLYSFSYPLGTINNISTVTPPSCPGGNASVTLSPTGGIDGSNFLFSLDGAQYTSANTYTSPAETFSYFIKDENTVNEDVHGNVVTVNKSLVKYFELPITEPAKVAAQRVIPTNVTCAGSNNGSVSVANLSGGSGTYQYKVDDGAWQNPSSIVTGLVPGMHSVYLKDSQNNCPAENIGNINIKTPDSLKIDTMSVVQPKCELPNGSIKVEVKGGNKVYKYVWELNGNPYFTSKDTTDTITDLGNTLAHGIYHLHVTDIQGCELTRDITLNQYSNPAIGEVSITDVNCYGESNGSVTILPASITGTNPTITKSYIKGLDFVYTDTIRDLSQSFDTLKKGRYEIYAIDTYSCHSNLPYNVIVHQPDTVIYLVVDTIIPVLGKGSATGSIKSIVYGGNNGLKEINLLNSLGVCVDSSSQRNEFSFFFSGLKAGNYAIRAIDNKGCNFTTPPLTVKEPENALGFEVITKQNALCKSQTGLITVQGYGGWGGYTYKRTSYNAFYKRNSFEDLYAGNYLITVRDSLGATYSDTVVIYEPQDSLRSWISKLAVPACANNGSLQVQVSGGTAPYSISNQTTGNSLTALQPQSVNFANLSAGSYLFNVTDSNGCHFDLEIQLPDTNLLEIARLDPVFPSGINTSDGAIKATLKGGNLPYTYQWKQRFGSLLPETSFTLKNIPSGHYQLNAFESGGCSDTAYLYLPGINDIAFNIGEVGNETSYMAHDGYCTLSSVFNSWQNFELITPSNSHLYFNSTDSTALFYSKSNNVFLRNLSGGDYFISGIASTGEKVYAEFKIEPYLRFLISNVDIVNVDSTGGSNGKITIVVSGGGGNNHFAWEKLTSSGNNILVGEDYVESSIMNNVPAGNYRIKVTDKYNNSIYDTIQVQEPASPLSISIAEYKNESCKTYEDAYVILKAAGGWGDYQFRDDVTPYFKNGNIFYNLNVRKHDFYLTDKKGTIKSISLNITEPDYLTSKVAFIDSVNCKSRTAGNIIFNVNGGTAPYRFANLNTPSIWTQDTIVHNIPAGYHTYLFTDNSNCIGQDTLTVLMPEPDSLLFDKIDVTHTTCSTDNGVIKIKMQGGTKPYRYEWLNSNNEPIGLDTIVTGLSQNGLYMLNILDRHDCPQHLEQRIKPSIKPIITDIDTIPVLCYGGSTGTAFITQVVPGTPYAPYSFTWSNGDTGEIARGFKEGVHFVTISDTNHCSTVKYFDITQPDSLWVTIIDSKNAHCYGYNDAFLKAEGRGGVGGYKYRWSTGDTTNLTDNLYKGSYSLSITDANACKNDDLFTITEPDKLLVHIGDDIKMCPGNSYTLDGKAFTTHKWSTSNEVVSNERYITVKEENNYYLEVTDSIGCFAWDTIQVSIGNDALKSDFLVSSQVFYGDTLKIFELSNLALDSLRWDFNDSIFSKVENTTGLDYILFLKTQKNGIYNIDLYAFSGGCVSKSTKQVEIIGEDTPPDNDDGLGYKDPLIISFIIAPNPTDGNFRADIILREAADIDLILFTVSSGIKVDERVGRGLTEYHIDYSFSELNSGAYLLILKAQNERKQIKILIQH